MRPPAEAVLVCAALSAGSTLLAQSVREPERTVAKVRFLGNVAVDDYTLGISISTSGPRGFPLLVAFGGGERRP